MSKPHERHPGAYYLVTRRTHERLFRLRPEADWNNAIGVITHDACARTGVELLGWVMMSNHVHWVVRDPKGLLPEWESQVNSGAAKYLNATQGVDVGTHLWDAQEDNAMELHGLAQIADKVAYCMANPVAAGAVYAPAAWPGLISQLEHIGTGDGPTFFRPKRYFGKRSRVSRVGKLVCHAPHGEDAAKYRRLVKRCLDAQLTEARAAMEASGRPYLGATKVKAASPFKRPQSPSERKAGAAAGGRRRLLGSTEEETRAMIARRQAFLERYYALLALVVEGVVGLVFPPGAFKLWRYYGFTREESGPLAAS